VPSFLLSSMGYRTRIDQPWGLQERGGDGGDYLGGELLLLLVLVRHGCNSRLWSLLSAGRLVQDCWVGWVSCLTY
jgi:hypothetical protein